MLNYTLLAIQEKKDRSESDDVEHIFSMVVIYGHFQNNYDMRRELTTTLMHNNCVLITMASSALNKVKTEASIIVFAIGVQYTMCNIHWQTNS